MKHRGPIRVCAAIIAIAVIWRGASELLERRDLLDQQAGRANGEAGNGAPGSPAGHREQRPGAGDHAAIVPGSADRSTRLDPGTQATPGMVRERRRLEPAWGILLVVAGGAAAASFMAVLSPLSAWAWPAASVAALIGIGIVMLDRRTPGAASP